MRHMLILAGGLEMKKTKHEILVRDFYTCQNPECQKHGNMANLELAHLVRQGDQKSKKNQTVQYIKSFILDEYGVELKKKQIWDIIHDERNVITSCSKCNSLFNIFNNPELRDAKIREIYEKEYLNK